MDELKSEILEKVWQCNDPIVLSNVLMMLSRSIVGMNKYWTWLNRTDLTNEQRLTHLLEELLDASNYITAIKHEATRNTKGEGDNTI